MRRTTADNHPGALTSPEVVEISEVEYARADWVLRAWVSRHCRDLDEQTREDVCQETWTRALQHVKRRGRREGAIDGLLVTIARNCVRDLRKMAKTRRTVPADPAEEAMAGLRDERPETAQQMHDWISEKQVRQLLRKLPSDEQRLLRLVYCDGLKPAAARKLMRVKRKRYELLHARALRRILPELRGGEAFARARDRLIAHLEAGEANASQVLTAQRLAELDSSMQSVLVRLGHTAHAIGAAVPADLAARASSGRGLLTRLTDLKEWVEAKRCGGQPGEGLDRLITSGFTRFTGESLVKAGVACVGTGAAIIACFGGGSPLETEPAQADGSRAPAIAPAPVGRDRATDASPSSEPVADTQATGSTCVVGALRTVDSDGTVGPWTRTRDCDPGVEPPEPGGGPCTAGSQGDGKDPKPGGCSIDPKPRAGADSTPSSTPADFADPKLQPEHEAPALGTSDTPAPDREDSLGDEPLAPSQPHDAPESADSTEASVPVPAPEPPAQSS